MKKAFVSALVFVLMALSYGCGQKPASIEGRYDLYVDGHPEEGVRTHMEIFGQKGNSFSVRGIEQDWGGQGTLKKTEGYYDWKFGDGRTGRTTITVNSDGTITGHVSGSGLDWVYMAKKKSGEGESPH
jgi:hypothetical protein